MEELSTIKVAHLNTDSIDDVNPVSMYFWLRHTMNENKMFSRVNKTSFIVVPYIKSLNDVETFDAFISDKEKYGIHLVHELMQKHGFDVVINTESPFRGKPVFYIHRIQIIGTDHSISSYYFKHKADAIEFRDLALKQINNYWNNRR